MVQTTLPAMTPAQAQYILNKMVEDRRLSYNDIVKYLAILRADITKLKAELAELEGKRSESSSGGQARKRTKRSVGKESRAKRTRAGRKLPPRAVTAKQQASRRIQGQYLALLTRIPKKDRPKFQKIAKEQSRDAAIKALHAAKEK